MIAPVLQATKEAYWQRNADGYATSLRLARQLAPEDPAIRTLWRRRWFPLSLLKLYDRLAQSATGFRPRIRTEPADRGANVHNLPRCTS
jgi:hypothetical protein